MCTATPHVGQHLFIGVNGCELTAATGQLLATVQPGGIALFARNVGSPAEFRALTAGLTNLRPHRPILAIDQENRRVNRLREIVGELPSVTDVKQTGDARPFGQSIGQSLRACGINLDFAPVLDLELFDERTDNALRDRCWGKTPAEVQQWAGQFVAGLAGAGVAACAKHFPGLGASRQDSHDRLPTIECSRGELIARDVRPFRELSTQLPAIMVGHGHYPAFDGRRPVPASLSRNLVTGLLRDQLGFQGLVVTDDLEMGAISQWGVFEEAVVAAFNAGADMLLVCHRPDRVLAAHEALMKAVESKRIPAERLIESRQRIAAFRQRWLP